MQKMKHHYSILEEEKQGGKKEREKKRVLKKKNKVERFACVCSVARSCPALCGAIAS